MSGQDKLLPEITTSCPAAIPLFAVIFLYSEVVVYNQSPDRRNKLILI